MVAIIDFHMEKNTVEVNGYQQLSWLTTFFKMRVRNDDRIKF